MSFIDQPPMSFQQRHVGEKGIYGRRDKEAKTFL